MKLKKKSLIIIACAIALVTFGSLAASAEETNVHLYKSQSSANSSAIISSDSQCWGVNDSTSEYCVYVILRRAYTYNGIYETDNQELLLPGAISSDIYNTKSSPIYEWKVQLNPEGWLTKNCVADGYLLSR